MNQDKICILAIDDEPRYLRAIQANLLASGYEMITGQNGQAAVELAASQKPDLILLDLRMPGMDGYEACQKIRTFSSVPIIMLTAMADEFDKVKGLNLGADDYITKPFGAEELLARIRAVLRRQSSASQPSSTDTFQAGDLLVEFEQKRVFITGREVKLTPIEFRLLSVLVKSPKHIFIPEYLIDVVWGKSGHTENHLVWQAIHRLRQKIEPDPQNPKYIQTEPGMGYMFILPE